MVNQSWCIPKSTGQVALPDNMCCLVVRWTKDETWGTIWGAASWTKFLRCKCKGLQWPLSNKAYWELSIPKMSHNSKNWEPKLITHQELATIRQKGSPVLLVNKIALGFCTRNPADQKGSTFHQMDGCCFWTSGLGIWQLLRIWRWNTMQQFINFVESSPARFLGPVCHQGALWVVGSQVHEERS